jgi:hypothetical protein
LARFKTDASGCHHAMNVNVHEHPLAPSVQRDKNAWFAAELLLTHFHENSYGDFKEQVVAIDGIVLKELG